MSSAAQTLELTLAEGLLDALGDPAGRALDTARRLLNDDGLDEDGARGRLLEMLKPGGCPACGAAEFEGKCGSCGHELREAEAVADLPEGSASALPRELPKRKRKRRRKPKEGTTMDEATYAQGARTPWGGVPYAGSDGGGVPVVGAERRDADRRPRMNVPADRVLLRDLQRSEPPSLRDADGWERCGNCVFFGKDECNLYGWARDGEADVVHRGGFPVDVDDVCDSHRTLSPQVRRLTETLDREDERLAEAARAANSQMVVRARARVARAEEMLTEAVAPDAEPRRARGESAGHYAARLLVETWSDAARKAAQLARGHGGGSVGVDIHHLEKAQQQNHVRSMKPGDTAHFGNGVHVNRTDRGFEIHGAGVAKHVTQDIGGAVEHARTRAVGGVVSDHFGSRVPSRKPGEHRMQYEVRRLHKVTEARAELIEVASAAYPGLDRSPKENWVDKAGGLPRYIERIAKHLHYEKGKEIGHAIAIAVNVVKKMCASGDTNFPGKQSVNPKSRAEACAAVAQWEAKKGKARAKTAAKHVSEADVWDDLGALLEMTEAAHRPIPPSDRFIATLHEELARSFGPDWMIGLAALDEADELLERYADTEVGVTLDEAGVVTLFHKVPGFAGKWDELKHPRTAKGRSGGGEFAGRSGGVLAKIEAKARGRGGIGGRDRQRGYRHPHGTTDVERAVAELYDRGDRVKSSAEMEFPSPLRQITPAERRALGGYLRKRGAPVFADKIEKGTSRSISGIDLETLARTIRGEGRGTQTVAPVRARMPWTPAGRIGVRGMPPTEERMTPVIAMEFPGDYRHGRQNEALPHVLVVPLKAGGERRYRSANKKAAEKQLQKHRDTVAALGTGHLYGEARVEPAKQRKKRSLPSDGGTGQGDEPLVGRAASSVEDLFKQDNAGRRNESIGGGGDEFAVDHAIAGVLQTYPGVKDWNVEKVGDKWNVHVETEDGKHVIAVDAKGHTEYVEGPGFGSDSKPEPKPAAKAAPAASLAHTLHQITDFDKTGDSEKPYHMEDGQFFLGDDGVLYEKLASGPKLMMGKKGPLAGVRIRNHQTGTEKVAPAFALSSYYPLLVPKGSAPKMVVPEQGGGDLFAKLKTSVGGGQSEWTPEGQAEIIGKHFVITGTIPGMTRKQAEAKLEALGGYAHSSVSNKVDLLITGDDVGKTKTNKAAALGVKVVPWHHFPHLQEEAAMEEGVFAAGKHPRTRGGEFGPTVRRKSGPLTARSIHLGDLGKALRYASANGGTVDSARALKTAALDVEDQAKQSRWLRQDVVEKLLRAHGAHDMAGRIGGLREAELGEARSPAARTKARLSAATNTMEIVRLRARRDALREGIFNRAKHPHGRSGRWAETLKLDSKRAMVGSRDWFLTHGTSAPDQMEDEEIRLSHQYLSKLVAGGDQHPALKDRMRRIEKEARSRKKPHLVEAGGDQLGEGIFDRAKHPHGRGGRWAETLKTDAMFAGMIDAPPVAGPGRANEPLDGYHAPLSKTRTFQNTGWRVTVGQMPNGKWAGEYQSAAASRPQRMYHDTEEEAVAAVKQHLGLADGPHSPAEEDALDLWHGPPSAQDVAWRRSRAGRKSRADIGLPPLREATLSAKSRDKIDDADFALPGRRYPIHDESHARNALSRVAQHGTPAEKARVKAKVKHRYPHIGGD